ncbi:WhiB family transcriptional regulator [Pimelobacter simplex]|uniref:WhiB family transcriptional regulator n=1 Tax=Nocardioides simplex TaxID=2045 RepID=UPI0037FAA7A5
MARHAARARVSWVEDWAPRAACRGAEPEQMFVRGVAQNKAKEICAGCPVRTECLAEALDNRIEWGVWGGMTERERQALLRRRPSDSWRPVLEAARVESARVATANTVWWRRPWRYVKARRARRRP